MNPSKSDPGRVIGVTLRLAALSLLLVTTSCYVGTWDAVAAITVFPQWTWALPGLLFLYVSRRLCGRHWSHLAIAGLWCCAIIAFSDNLVSLVRGVIGNNERDSMVVRVITLNCAGRMEAAQEAVALSPDILLLQEIPPAEQLVTLSAAFSPYTNSYISGLDCAIFVKGEVIAPQTRFSPQFIQGHVKLQGLQLFVTSLRLIPPEGRIDLWTAEAWKVSAENRRFRRAQLRDALAGAELAGDLPEIMGGDFNAPAGDRVFRLLANYRDAHRENGRGWGNTALNNIPIARPDQIWVKNLEVRSCRTVKTKGSDHRMVVVELKLPNQSG